jgi:hypothetical protein
MVLKHQGHFVLCRRPQGRIAQQERMMRMYQFGVEILEFGTQVAWNGQPDREVAAVEILNGGDSDNTLSSSAGPSRKFQTP